MSRWRTGTPSSRKKRSSRHGIASAPGSLISFGPSTQRPDSTMALGCLAATWVSRRRGVATSRTFRVDPWSLNETALNLEALGAVRVGRHGTRQAVRARTRISPAAPMEWTRPERCRRGEPPPSSIRSRPGARVGGDGGPCEMPRLPPAVEVQRDAQGAAVVALRGELDVSTASRARRELIGQLMGRPIRSLEIDARDLERGDMSGMVILHELRSGMFTQGVRGRVTGLRLELEKLLAAFPSDETLRRIEAGPAPVGVPEEIGAATLSLVR